MLDQAFDALKTYDTGVDPNVLQPIHDAIITSHGDAAALKSLESRLAAVLTTKVSHAAKDAVCRALQLIGTAASVPALATLLADEKLSHMARYALERIPAPEAGQTLRTALAQVSAKLKIGIISSLGARREDLSVPPLQAMLNQADATLAKSAAHALGAIASLAAAKALVTTKPSAAAAAAHADAAMACAERLVVGGNKAAAKITYELLLRSNPSPIVKDAATRGLKTCAAS